jgi:cytochrome P450
MVYAADFKKYHQLTLSILKQFGFGKLGGVMEARIQGEVTGMIADLKASHSQPIDPVKIVDCNVMNVIATILFGKRYEKNDPQVQGFLDHNCQLIRSAAKTMPLASIPILRYLPYYRQALEDSRANLLWYSEILEQKIEECVQDETETPCFIRSFIEAEGSQTYDKLQLSRTLQDLVLAGSETSATTIKWSIALIANHQEIQSRLQTEIDSVVPRERMPSLDDRSQLPFVEAFTMELMRYKTIAPIGVAHETSKDAVIQGFHIPANTTVGVGYCGCERVNIT